jgi:hypothetical protein
MKVSLIDFVCFDVVVDALQTFEPLQEFVGFVSIMQVGKVFPLDVKALFMT